MRMVRMFLAALALGGLLFLSAPVTTATDDTTGPNVTINRPNNSLYINDSQAFWGTFIPVVSGPLTVEAWASDPESGVAGLTFTVDGVAVDPGQVSYNSSTEVFSFVFRASEPGLHKITARATNTAGLTGSAAEIEILATD